MTLMPLPKTKAELVKFVQQELSVMLEQGPIDVAFIVRPSPEHEFLSWTYKYNRLEFIDGKEVDRTKVYPRVLDMKRRTGPKALTVYGFIKPDGSGEPNATHIGSFENREGETILKSEFSRQCFLRDRRLQRYGEIPLPTQNQDTVIGRCWELLQANNGQVGALHIAADGKTAEGFMYDLHTRYLLIGKVEL